MAPFGIRTPFVSLSDDFAAECVSKGGGFAIDREVEVKTAPVQRQSCTGTSPARTAGDRARSASPRWSRPACPSRKVLFRPRTSVSCPVYARDDNSRGRQE